MAIQKNIIEEVFPETLKILSELIKFQTVSGTSNIDLIEYCEKKLSMLGATSFKTFDEAKLRANLFATINTNKESKGGIILSGHTDVVPASAKSWSSNPFKATEKKNKIAQGTTVVGKFLQKLAIVLLCDKFCTKKSTFNSFPDNFSFLLLLWV